MRGIKWVGPFYDGSGYAAAAREYVFALDNIGYPVCVVSRCFEQTRLEVDGLAQLEKLEKVVCDYDVVVAQLTPDMASQHFEESKYNIAYFAWETTKVHPAWVDHLNKADEVWVPSQWNVGVLKSSGVTRPVKRVPHVANPSKFEGVESSFDLGLSDDVFKFYSIFQWNERKNPEALIRTYFASFTQTDPVALVLKAYLAEGGPKDKQVIAEYVNFIKKDMGLPVYPKVLLISSRLSDQEMREFHSSMDCYVSLTHAEGFGLTPMDAGLAGKPVICTAGSGVMEFLTPKNSFLVKSHPTLVKGMSGFNPWYLGTGTWFDPDELDTIEKMRFAAVNKDVAAGVGGRLKKDLHEKLSPARVSSIIVSLIEGK